MTNNEYSQASKVLLLTIGLVCGWHYAMRSIHYRTMPPSGLKFRYPEDKQ